jgi:hypothetical protein
MEIIDPIRVEIKFFPLRKKKSDKDWVELKKKTTSKYH